MFHVIQSRICPSFLSAKLNALYSTEMMESLHSTKQILIFFKTLLSVLVSVYVIVKRQRVKMLKIFRKF